VTLCTEKEATSRGAALLALERIKAIADAGAIPAATGKTFMPEPARTAIYKRLQARQHALYHVLIEDKW
jgi:sugar (pentulose or hexulose) kinase